VPCDQVRTVEVEFNEGTDLAALALALEGLGFTEVEIEGKSVEFAEGRFEAGKFEIAGGIAFDYETFKGQIARAYTKATLLGGAERFGWATKAAATAQKALAGFTRRW